MYCKGYTHKETESGREWYILITEILSMKNFKRDYIYFKSINCIRNNHADDISVFDEIRTSDYMISNQSRKYNLVLLIYFSGVMYISAKWIPGVD